VRKVTVVDALGTYLLWGVAAVMVVAVAGAAILAFAMFRKRRQGL